MKTTRVISVLLSLLLSLPLAQQAGASVPYICTTKGAVLRYERVFFGSGRLKWRHVMTVDDVSMGLDATRVRYHSEFNKAGGSQMYGGPLSFEAIVDSRGTVCVNLGASIASAIKNIFPKADIDCGDEHTELPAVLVPGMRLPDVATKLKVAMMTYSVQVDCRQVLRTETLTTPAGTFDCVVVTEHKIEKGLGRNRETTALTWYAHGVGMVRHDTYDKKMKIETSEVLNSLTL